MHPRFFRSQGEFRRWLERNHARADELLVGFYKKASGRGGITYQQALDEALCFGWIDGVRRSLDRDRYTIRFTPRRARSIWSAVNLKRASELIAAGAMKPAGRAAYENRDEKRAKVYAYEQKNARFTAAMERRFRAERGAWEFFRAQAPSYQRTVAWWVTSAKKEETRERRLNRLIEESARGNRVI